MQSGWKCEECGRVNAPWLETCPCYAQQGVYTAPEAPTFPDPYPFTPYPPWSPSGPFWTTGGATHMEFKLENYHGLS
jgi:hypothetical protein